MPRNAVHPKDHRNNEDRGQQEQQAFETVLIDLPAFQGDGYGKAEGSGESHAGPDEPSEMRTAGAGEID